MCRVWFRKFTCLCCKIRCFWRGPDHARQLTIINIYYYTDGNHDDYRAGAKLDATEEDACATADVSAPKLPPKPQPQVE